MSCGAVRGIHQTVSKGVLKMPLHLPAIEGEPEELYVMVYFT